MTEYDIKKLDFVLLKIFSCAECTEIRYDTNYNGTECFYCKRIMTQLGNIEDSDKYGGRVKWGFTIPFFPIPKYCPLREVE